MQYNIRTGNEQKIRSKNASGYDQSMTDKEDYPAYSSHVGADITIPNRDDPIQKRQNRAGLLLLKIAGTLSLVIGGIGIILPLLPTTPFLLLAVVCYAKSSKRWYRWLIYNRWFGEYIRNWHEGRGIPMKTKVLSILFLILTIGYCTVFVVPFFIGKVALVIVAVCVSVHILSFPTLESDVRF